MSLTIFFTFALVLPGLRRYWSSNTSFNSFALRNDHRFRLRIVIIAYILSKCARQRWKWNRKLTLLRSYPILCFQSARNVKLTHFPSFTDEFLDYSTTAVGLPKRRLGIFLFNFPTFVCKIWLVRRTSRRGLHEKKIQTNVWNIRKINWASLAKLHPSNLVTAIFRLVFWRFDSQIV